MSWDPWGWRGGNFIGPWGILDFLLCLGVGGLSQMGGLKYFKYLEGKGKV